MREPDFLAARREYERFHERGGLRASQTVFGFEEAFEPFQTRMFEYVDRLFWGKCAYTEVTMEPRSVHLHRPEADAYDEQDMVSADHYWWLAPWYRNWYMASGEVAARKRTNFPLLGPRALIPERDPDSGVVGRPHLYRDRGALLDPSEDHPQLHLSFSLDGTVEPWARIGAPWLSDDEDRGIATIELLGLNSPFLVDARRREITTALSIFELNLDPSDLLNPGLPHLGAIRQALAVRLLSDNPRSLSTAQRSLAPELVPLVAAEPDRFSTALVDAVRASVASQPERALARVLDAARIQRRSRTGREPAVRLGHSQAYRDKAETVAPTAAISRVRISNFQTIDDFDFTFPSSPEAAFKREGDLTQDHGEWGAAQPRRPWWVLLGENGAGKSSVLKAMALALAGTSLEDLVGEVRLEWGDVLRRGTASGSVRIDFDAGPSLDLRFDANGATFTGGAPRVKPFLRGFGATRLLEDADSTQAQVRLGNLFDPRIPVIDAEQWLLDIPDERDFNAVAVSLARLLDRQDDVAENAGAAMPKFLERRNGNLTVGGDPLRSLSDGYRTVIATACDLMAGAAAGLSDMRNASGIVLLDELGSHLHPRWKMKITRTLRSVFPSMQFVVSTHDPLCLRGVAEQEVIGVRTSAPDQDGRTHAHFEVIAQSPSRLRVDQLLTSEFFGLNTTIDPEVDEQFRRYYALVRRNLQEEGEERHQLRAELSRHGVLGYTARDQLVYEAIDEFLAHEGDMDPEVRVERRRQTLRSVGEIWRNVATRRGEGLR